MEEFKAKIEEFVQSLSKEEPFNGDEVEELGRYFVTELCKQNAEEDQIKHILIDPAESLFGKCIDIYENDGQSAVIRHCEGLKHPDWGTCLDCECVAPFVYRDGEKRCLICSFGSVVN